MGFKKFIKYIIGWEKKDNYFEFIKRFLIWEADVALRYQPILDFLKDKKDLNILEIGSGSIGLAGYYKKNIIGLDIKQSDLKLSNLNLILTPGGSFENINQKFDLVVCLDVFEHIEPSKRLDFLKEAFRLSKKYLIIGGPEGEKSLESDKIYNERYKKITGCDHHFQIEHLNYTLPNYKDLLTKIDFKYNILEEKNNLNLKFWEFINIKLMYFNLYFNIFMKIFFRILYNLYKNNHQLPVYRKLFIIEI